MLCRKFFALAVAGLSVVIATESWGRDLFVSSFTLDSGQTESKSTNSFLDVGSLFDEASLTALFGADYVVGVSEVVGNLNLRGVEVIVTYADGLSVLKVEIPTAGVEFTLNGTTRDQSEAEFQAWLEGEGEQGDREALSALLREFVEQSPVDPVAGNPNSLESRIFDGDFELGSMGPFLGDFPADTQDFPNLFKLDFNFGHFAAGPYGGQTYELDLAYGWNPSKRLSVVTDLAFVFDVSEGEALTGMGHFGLGLQGRIKEWWNLSLLARGGIAGSVDVGAAGAMYSVSLVSHFRHAIGDYWFEMRTLVGVANTIEGIEIEGISLDYNLTNVALKNGFSINRAFPLGSFSRPLQASIFYTRSDYFVDELWLDETNEIGVGVGLVSRDGIQAYSPVSLDTSYVFADGYDALKLAISLRF